MDNQQFRRLLVNSPAQQDANFPPTRTPGAVLGARKNASIPMTPRQVGRNSIQADFARQLAERNAKANTQKKFRSAAPKGSQLVAGFTDRTKARVDDEDDERAKRIKNLEEAMKLDQIDSQTFEKLVQDITGGDIAATHLVKGLDRKLLERVKKGEDVFGAADPKQEEHQDGEGGDVEDEFDELAEKDVGAIVREKTEKKGEMAPPKPVAGVKRSRADILAELKRQRAEAAAEHEKKYPSLGKGFRKVNGRGESSRIEIDRQGREVLIITDAHGKEKRKVRKQKVEELLPEVRHDLDDEKKPINTYDLPPSKEEQEESDDEDIFGGVGSNYNPLADLNSEDESSEEEGESEGTKPAPNATPSAPVKAVPKDDRSGDEEIERLSSNATTTAQIPPTKRDYFATSKTFASKDANQPSESSAADATVRAALQKVRTLDPTSSLINDADSQEARLKARLAKLSASDRDMEDIDVGFGGSRFDDAEEMEREGEKVKFPEWKGIGGDEEDEEGGGARGGKKRKRGPKKKKGDKNSATDVLKAMERQKEKALG